MRGKAVALVCTTWLTWITPAYAGKSLRRAKHHFAQKDHPRVCGEKKFGMNGFETKTGSPPRMRGKATVFRPQDIYTRITPAYAGKSIALNGRVIVRKDHPRVCGEKDRTIAVQNQPQGSPPRMRGKDF